MWSASVIIGITTMDKINYKGIEYPTFDVIIENETYTASVMSLWETIQELVDNGDEEATEIDNQIVYYVEDNEFKNLPMEELEYIVYANVVSEERWSVIDKLYFDDKFVKKIDTDQKLVERLTPIIMQRITMMTIDNVYEDIATHSKFCGGFTIDDYDGLIVRFNVDRVGKFTFKLIYRGKVQIFNMQNIAMLRKVCEKFINDCKFADNLNPLMNSVDDYVQSHKELFNIKDGGKFDSLALVLFYNMLRWNITTWDAEDEVETFMDKIDIPSQLKQFYSEKKFIYEYTDVKFK